MILNKVNFFSGPRNKEQFNLGGTGYGIIDGPDGKEDGTNPGLGLDKQLHLSFWFDMYDRRSHAQWTIFVCETLKKN